MEDSTEKQAAPEDGLLTRFFGVVFMPMSTFAKVAQAPRWLGILVVVTLAYALGVGGFMSTEVGQEAWMDQVLESKSPFGGQVGEQQMQGFERIAPYAGYVGFALLLIFIPIATLGVAAIGFAVFNAGFGGNATFKQVFAVVAHAGAVGALLQIFIWPLNYVRESMASPTSLAALLPFVEEGTFPFRLLRAVDLGRVWWVVVLAIGLGVLYRRKAGAIAAAFLSVYAVIAVIVASVTS